MFALTRGELAIVVFIFALVWGASVLPRVGERVGAWWALRSRGLRSGQPGSSRDGG